MMTQKGFHGADSSAAIDMSRAENPFPAHPIMVLTAVDPE
jgi:hypothetical protein